MSPSWSGCDTIDRPRIDRDLDELIETDACALRACFSRIYDTVMRSFGFIPGGKARLLTLTVRCLFNAPSSSWPGLK